MKYRLKESGEDSLKDYIDLQKIQISWIARRIDKSRMGVDNIIKGRTGRSDPDTIGSIAKCLKMEVDYDEEGIFFVTKKEASTVEEKREILTTKLDDAINKIPQLEEALKILYTELRDAREELKQITKKEN